MVVHRVQQQSTRSTRCLDKHVGINAKYSTGSTSLREMDSYKVAQEFMLVEKEKGTTPKAAQRTDTDEKHDIFTITIIIRSIFIILFFLLKYNIHGYF